MTYNEDLIYFRGHTRFIKGIGLLFTQSNQIDDVLFDKGERIIKPNISELIYDAKREILKSLLSSLPEDEIVDPCNQYLYQYYILQTEKDAVANEIYRYDIRCLESITHLEEMLYFAVLVLKDNNLAEWIVKTNDPLLNSMPYFWLMLSKMYYKVCGDKSRTLKAIGEVISRKRHLVSVSTLAYYINLYGEEKRAEKIIEDALNNELDYVLLSDIVDNYYYRKGDYDKCNKILRELSNERDLDTKIAVARLWKKIFNNDPIVRIYLNSCESLCKRTSHYIDLATAYCSFLNDLQETNTYLVKAEEYCADNIDKMLVAENYKDLLSSTLDSKRILSNIECNSSSQCLDVARCYLEMYNDIEKAIEMSNLALSKALFRSEYLQCLEFAYNRIKEPNHSLHCLHIIFNKCDTYEEKINTLKTVGKYAMGQVLEYAYDLFNSATTRYEWIMLKELFDIIEQYEYSQKCSEKNAELLEAYFPII